MKLLKYQKGFTLMEVLVSTVVLLSALWAMSGLYIHYMDTSHALDRGVKSLGLGLLTISDVHRSPMRKIINLCNSKKAWQGRKSSCRSLEQPGVLGLPLHVESGQLPSHHQLLGTNLRGYLETEQASSSCLDLTRCRYMIGDSVLELTFEYRFRGQKKSEEVRTIKVVRSER